MARLGYKIVGAIVLAVSGLGIFETAVSTYELLLSPLSEHELRRIEGTLLDVSQCSRGRRASYKLIISADTEPATLWQGCPSKWHPALAKSIGRQVQVTLAEKRSSGHPQIYTLKIDEDRLQSHEEMSAHLRSVRWLSLFLLLLAAGCYLGMTYLVVSYLRKTVNLPAEAP